jgi:hypothetical protein
MGGAFYFLLSSDGKTCFSYDLKSNKYFEWEIPSLKIKNKIDNGYGSGNVNFSPDGTYYIKHFQYEGKPSNDELKMCITKNNKAIYDIDKRASCFFSVKGNYYFSKIYNIDSTEIRETATNKPIKKFYSPDYYQLAQSPDEQKIFIAQLGSHFVSIINIKTGNIEQNYSSLITPTIVSNSNTNQLFTRYRETISRWDILNCAFVGQKTIKPISSYNRDNSRYGEKKISDMDREQIKFSPDGKYYILTSDGTFFIFDTETNKEVYRNYDSDIDISNSVCNFSPDSKRFIFGTDWYPKTESRNFTEIQLDPIKELRKFSAKLGYDQRSYTQKVFYTVNADNVLKKLVITDFSRIYLWDLNAMNYETLPLPYNNIGIPIFIADKNYMIYFTSEPNRNAEVANSKWEQKINVYDYGIKKQVKTITLSPSERLFTHSNPYMSKNGEIVYFLNTDKYFQAWSLEKEKQIFSVAYPGDRYNFISTTSNDKILVTSDNSYVEFRDAFKGNLLARLIISLNNGWLIYTPEGYWDGSSNCGDLLTMVNNFEVIGIDQFAVRNNRPDMIVKQFNPGNTELISHYYNMFKKRLRKLGLTETNLGIDAHVPETKIISSDISENQVKINFTLNDTKYNLMRYNIFINDVPCFGSDGKTITGQNQNLNETLILTNGTNKVEVSCMNEQGIESYRAITYAFCNKQTVSNLYFLAFGVSKYKNSSYNLQYADKDALDLEKVIQSMKGKGFENVYTKVLTNEQVTPEAIKASKDFVKNAKVDDTFILFIAGHGMHDKDAEATYYFLTSNADINNLKGTAADFETIEDLLQGIPPRKKLFLMDACESGEIDEETYETLAGSKTLSGLGIASRGFKATSAPSTVNTQPSAKRTYLYQKDRYIYNDLVRRSGAIVFSSSKGDELSYERSDIENGLFTEYIMKALATTEADKDSNGIVSTDELRQYVSEQVAKASGELQHPTVDRDNIYQKFGFGIK